MKKFIIAVATAFISLSGFSQLSFGVQATANLGHATANSQYPEVNYKKTSMLLPGAGLVAQYRLSKKFELRSGINYLQTGVNLKQSWGDETGASTRFENRLHYLQVPVTLLYNIHAGSTKVYAGAGAYAGYGIGGKSRATLKYFTGEGGTDEIITKETLPLFKKSENYLTNVSMFLIPSSILPQQIFHQLVCCSKLLLMMRIVF